MAFRLLVNGFTLECESLSDAVALVGNIVQAHGAARAPHPRASSRSSVATAPTDMHAARAWQPPEHLRSFIGALAENDRAAIGLLATCGGEVALNQLGAAAGLESTQEASAMIARVKRVALEHGLDWSKVLSFRIAGARSERTSFYSPGPLLVATVAGAR